MEWLSVKYRQIQGSRRKSMWFSMISTFVLLLVCYLTDNIGYSLLSGPSVGQRIEQFREFSGLSKDVIPDDVVFINIAYDRELVPVRDEYSLPKGNIDITNRDYLNRFLSEAEGYRHMLLDVLISKDYQSESDSLLVATIKSKKDISIALSEDTELIDSTLLKIAGYTDYSTDILETNFVKYEFSKGSQATMPLKAYRELTGDAGFKSFGPLHFHNGRLSWKCLTLRFPTKLWIGSRHNDENSMLEEKIILNLGSDILDTGLDIKKLIKDKIVIIGDFTEDDIHDTYLGKIAGPVINLNALEALFRNELEIPWSLVVFLFMTYTAVSYIIVRRVSFAFVTKIVSKYSKRSLFTRYLISFLGISALLTGMAIVIYLISGCDINIIIPSLCFTLLRGFTNSLNE